MRRIDINGDTEIYFSKTIGIINKSISPYFKGLKKNFPKFKILCESLLTY